MTAATGERQAACMLTDDQKLHDILRSNMLFSVFSRAYEFPGQLKQKQGPVKPSGFYEPAFKKEADIFEAVVGGLHLDSAAVPGGAIAIQKWFDILIEPWIDWTLTRMNSNLKSSFMTYNRIPLEPRKPSKALAHAPPGSRARAGSPRRKIAVASSSRIARRAAKKAPRHSTIGGWPGAPEGMNVDAMHAGAEERRWARIQRLEDYQTFEVQTPRGDRPAPEHTVDGQGHGMHRQSQGLRVHNASSMALMDSEQNRHRNSVYRGDPGYSRDHTRLPDLRVRRPAPPPVPYRPLVDYTDLVGQRPVEREQRHY